VINSDAAWKVVLLVPQSELQLQARSRQQALIFSLFASVAIASGLTVWLSRRQEQRQTENRRIQETNAFFKSVLDALAEPLYVIDVKTYEVVIANQAARNLGNPEPYTCYALTHRRDRPCTGQNDPCPLQIIQKTNAPVVVEHTHFDAEGKPQIVEVHGYPICDEYNQPRYLVEYSLDITARRQTETEIRKLSQAVEQSANTIIITDAKGRIEYANPKCTKTTGYRLDELLGETPRLFNSGKQSKEYYHQLWTTIRSGKEWRGEFCNRRKDGTLYWEQASIAPLLDNDGEITHFIAVKEDITARKKAEEELQISQEQLHKKAQDLSLTLQELRRTQAQLIHTEKMSSLMQLVAGIAHEINNPLNFITNNLAYLEIYAQDMIRLIQLYQQSYPQPPVAIVEELEAIEFDYLCEDLDKLTISMKSGVERITSIILSLRTFSRMDESDLKRVDLHDGLESTLTFLDGLLTHSKTGERIEIVRDYGILPQVECYAGQLNQVFMNILRNAIEALHSDESAADPSGQKEINIQTRLLDKNEDYVYIKICDNGPGIAPEILPQVFDPFFTTKPVGQGSGLGLAVSYQIVQEQHCGQLDCYSTPGAGATFVVTIPIRQATSSCLLSKGARS
jgi:PAS domain S-box-containing protein